MGRSEEERSVAVAGLGSVRRESKGVKRMARRVSEEGVEDTLMEVGG